MTYFRSEKHGFRCDVCGEEESEEVAEVPESEGSAWDFEDQLVNYIKDKGWLWHEPSDSHYCSKECALDDFTEEQLKGTKDGRIPTE
jgi:hypothetical protein